MKKHVPSKSINRRISTSDKEPIGDFSKEIAARIMASLKKAFGCDTLEGARRVSWRQYLGVILVPIFFGLAASTACAGTPAEKSQAPEFKMMSREGEMKTRDAKKKNNEIKKSWEDQLPKLSEEEANLEGVNKTAEGVVSGAGYNGLAVEASAKSDPKDPDEIWFNYLKGVKLSGVKKLSELQAGDTVRVVYKEVNDRRRFLKEIALIRKKPEEVAPPSAEEESISE